MQAPSFRLFGITVWHAFKVRVHNGVRRNRRGYFHWLLTVVIVCLCTVLFSVWSLTWVCVDVLRMWIKVKLRVGAWCFFFFVCIRDTLWCRFSSMIAYQLAQMLVLLTFKCNYIFLTVCWAFITFSSLVHRKAQCGLVQFVHFSCSHFFTLPYLRSVAC